MSISCSSGFWKIKSACNYYCSTKRLLMSKVLFVSSYFCIAADVIPGMMRWQMKLWRNVHSLLKAREISPPACRDYETEFNLAMQTNRTIEQVYNFDFLFSKNVLSLRIW